MFTVNPSDNRLKLRNNTNGQVRWFNMNNTIIYGECIIGGNGNG